jgi:outer membrane protein OmpA-like peptidoglycan-associated protein
MFSEVVLLFAFDKSDLTEDSTSKLDSAVETMKLSGQGMSFSLEGHADASGPDAYNERLGLARAENVKRYLAERHEIPVDRISVVSHGESQPVASNDTREGRAKNRRVVVAAGG